MCSLSRFFNRLDFISFIVPVSSGYAECTGYDWVCYWYRMAKSRYLFSRRARTSTPKVVMTGMLYRRHHVVATRRLYSYFSKREPTLMTKVAFMETLYTRHQSVVTKR